LTTAPSDSGRQQLLALGARGLLEHRAARHDHVIPLAVELDDLEVHRLAFVRRGVLDRTQVDERAGQEGADALYHHREAALHLAGDDALHLLGGLQRFLQVQPGRHALGLLARQHGLAVAVLQRLDRHADEVAGLDRDLAGVVAEFFQRNGALGLQAGVDDDEVLVDAHDFGGDDLADAHFLARQAFFEKGFERLGSGGGTWKRLWIRRVKRWP
jgi:hypothetical protein